MTIRDMWKGGYRLIRRSEWSPTTYLVLDAMEREPIRSDRSRRPLLIADLVADDWSEPELEFVQHRDKPLHRSRV